MPLTAAGRTLAAAAFIQTMPPAPPTYLSLHTAPPGDGGLNEVTGGVPAYARKPLVLVAGAPGQVQLSGSATFDVPALTDVLFVGMWDAITAGHFLGWLPAAGGNLQGVASGDASTDVLTCAGHGLVDDDLVILVPAVGRLLPSALAIDTVYHVINKTADTFQLATAQGGLPITLGLSGLAAFQRAQVVPFVTQGSLTVSAASLAIGV
jgi:hypothetical protein